MLRHGDDGPRPVQDRQRHARSSCRRRADPQRMRDPARAGAGTGLRRAPGRRRVRDALAGHRRGRGVEDRRAAAQGSLHQLKGVRPLGPGWGLGRPDGGPARHRPRSDRRDAPRRPRAQRSQAWR
ncbi:hypothetical protein QU38_02235, partial [Staphylococcus aureus]